MSRTVSAAPSAPLVQADAEAAAEAKRRRSRATALVLTSALGAAMALALGLALAQVVAEPMPLFVMLGAAWVALVLGRVLWYIDLPAGYGGVWAELGMGAAAGLATMGTLNSFFTDGPGWPATPWYALGAGFAWGAYRGHGPILRRIRALDEPPRLLGGVLDPREGGALALLVAGYAAFGFAAYRVFLALAGLIPQSAKFGMLAIALYGVHGARLLLRFAAHDAGPAKGGFVGWFKANLLRNALVVLLLVGYATYRGELSEVVPYFPLVEFALGMAVFGAVIARLRHVLRRERTDHATNSDARPHEQRVEPLTEGEYEAVARPVSRFLETGRGIVEYQAVIRETSRLKDHEAERALEPARRYQAPLEPPPLPLAWGIAASVMAGVALATGTSVLLLGTTQAATGELPPGVVGLAINLSLIVLGLSIYRTQDHARAHRLPWMALALALGGAALVLIGGGLTMRLLPSIPSWMWGAFGIGALLLVGVPVLLALRLAERLKQQTNVTLPLQPPSALLERGLAGTRKMAAMAAGGAVVLLVIVPFIIEWLVQVANVPEGVSATYDSIAGGTVWVLAAMGGSALVRYFGYARARPNVLAREKRWRQERLQLHSEIMRRLERV